jgi:hypothetical protein
MMKKAAIVIGINSVGELPVLRAAASGAQSFGAWLAGEGFEVKSFVDKDGPVTVTAVTEAITALIDEGPLQQLVVYFSGHGFLNNYSEFWMLSGAPRNPNEAISVRESVELARECGIQSVVMISDACRSTPQSLNVERVRGSLMFPNEPLSRDTRPEIDRYFAALPGDPALEMVVDKSVEQHEGVFTHCFLQAYRQPDAEMVRQLTSNGNVVSVIPNRYLKEYLRRKVPVLMRERGLMVHQFPDAIIESGENVFIGRAVVTDDAETRKTAPRDIIGVREVARVKLAGAFDSGLGLPPLPMTDSERAALDQAALQTGFNASVELIGRAQVQGVRHFETRTGTGLKVFGTRVSKVVGLNMRVDLLNRGDSIEPAYVRLYPGQAGVLGQGHVSSVILRFDDGSGTVLAGFEDYIGTVVVENGRVVNVSYVPSENSYQWNRYMHKRPRLEKLRAITAAAARYGVFRVNRENAGSVASQIRYLKSIDPTLGLYAAYAYAEVGLSDEVNSVLRYMVDNLHAMIFDVGMLAGKLAGSKSDPVIVPFCPMLSQGWGLLRVKRTTVPPILEEAANHMPPALWTTFDSTGMDLIFKGIQERRIS